MNSINDESSSIKSPRELGIIEKLCSTYGFVYCCHRDGRYFFHFSEYKNDIQEAKVGGKMFDWCGNDEGKERTGRFSDVVEFETTIDKRKKKPVAINITLASPEIIGENRVEGTIAVVARLAPPAQSNGVRTSASSSCRSVWQWGFSFPAVSSSRIHARWQSDLCEKRWNLLSPLWSLRSSRSFDSRPSWWSSKFCFVPFVVLSSNFLRFIRWRSMSVKIVVRINSSLGTLP